MSRRNESYVPLLCDYPDSEKINKVSEGAEAMFCRLLAKCDDEGNYYGSPKRLLGKLFALRYENGTMTARKVLRYRDELVTAMLITRYEYDGVEYIHINDCKKSLRKDVVTKVYFPEFVVAKGLNETVTGTGRVRNEHVTPIQSNPIQSKPNQDMCFERFWEVWPIKKDKGHAKKWWAKHKPDEQLAKIIVDAARRQVDAGMIVAGEKYMPLPTTWLNGERWTDGIENKKIPKRGLKADCSVCGKKATTESNNRAYCGPECRKKDLGW